MAIKLRINITYDCIWVENQISRTFISNVVQLIHIYRKVFLLTQACIHKILFVYVSYRHLLSGSTVILSGSVRKYISLILLMLFIPLLSSIVFVVFLSDVFTNWGDNSDDLLSNIFVACNRRMIGFDTIKN